MSVNLIFYQNGAKMMRPVTNREDYLSLRNSSQQQSLVSRIRQGEDNLKRQLVQMNYSCMPNGDGSLKGATTATTTVGMDIDHIADGELTAVRDRILAKKDELGLLMLELSARGNGYHLVFRRKAELSQEDNLKWASQLLGVAYDEGAKDITRVFFTTTADSRDLLFLHDDLFAVQAVGKAEEAGKAERDAEQQQTGSVAALQRCSRKDDSTPSVSYDPQARYNDILFTDIIAKFWELYYDGKTPEVGDRNVLTFELAMILRPICDFSLDRLMRVIPNYWGPEGEAEYKHTLENALKEPRKGMPYRLRQVLKAMKQSKMITITGGTMSTPPPMPKKLPALIRLLIQNVPDLYKPAVASGVFPALGTHFHGVKFRYWDNVDHEPTFMNVLIGHQSVGKSCIKKPIQFILEPIRQRDIPNRQREAEWKQKNPGAKQKKDPRPTDICIQIVVDNMTEAVFNQRVIDAENNGHRFIYLCVDEVEGLKKVTNDVGLLIRKAWDNADAGQERVGADSVTGIAPLRWNWNASTTPVNATNFFYKMVNDGTVSRLDVSTIIRDEDDFELPKIKIYDDKFAQDLKPYLDQAEAASGTIICKRCNDLAEEMSRENQDICRLMESDAYKDLSYRAIVIAWLKGMVLYVLNGCRWNKEIADFMRWSFQYNMWCKMLYFGNQLQKENDKEKAIMNQSTPRNLLALLDDEFSLEDYLLMRQQQGRQGNGRTTLRSWLHRGYIVFDDVTDRYCKTDTYKQMEANYM